MLNLYEWTCREYDDCVTTPDDAKRMLFTCLELTKHDGDCTNQNYTCSLCLVDCILNEYYTYMRVFIALKEIQPDLVELYLDSNNHAWVVFENGEEMTTSKFVAESPTEILLKKYENNKF